MSNLNQSVLDAAMHSVGLEKTNNKNDITVLENNTVRVLGNYKKTVEVDKEKHKVRVTEHKIGEFTDMDTLTNTKKTEITTKFNSSKDAITTAVRNNVNELKTSATGNINAIIAMQDAIGADSLINTTVAKSIAVGNTDGILIGEEIIKKDEFVLGLPDGCIFAVNYMEGDITDVINDNSPDGIESVKAYTGTGTFDNVDDSLCGQMIMGEGCWFGIGSENISRNMYNKWNSYTSELIRYSDIISLDAINYVTVGSKVEIYRKEQLHLRSMICNGKLTTPIRWRYNSNYSSGYYRYSMCNGTNQMLLGYDHDIAFLNGWMFHWNINEISKDSPTNFKYLEVMYTTDNIWSPYIRELRKQTEITYQDILEEV